MRFAYVHWYQHVGGWGRVPLEWENWTIDVCLSEAVEFNICIMCRLNVGWKKCWMELSWEEWIPSGECILQQQWQLCRLSWIDWLWISQWLHLELLVLTEICRTQQDLPRVQSPAKKFKANEPMQGKMYPSTPLSTVLLSKILRYMLCHIFFFFFFYLNTHLCTPICKHTTRKR